jgi:hypothetical protein
MLLGGNFFGGRPAPAMLIRDGEVTGGNTSINPISYTIGAAIGDLMVVSYYAPGRTIGGGGGAFTTYTAGDVALSWRVMTAGDFSNIITFSNVTPAAVTIWRGPKVLGAARSTVDINGSPSGQLAGFQPAAGMMGVWITTDPAAGATTVAAPWLVRALGTSGTYNPLAFSLENGIVYRGEAITVNRSSSTGDCPCAAFELLAY